MSIFNLALLAGASMAVEFNGHYPHQPVHHGGYDFGSHQSHVKVTNHQNPFRHIVEHHKYADSYELDPWERRNQGGDPDRSGWYSPYQQFSPAKIPYKPTVTHATFARCQLPSFFNREFGTALIGQLKGKAAIIKYDSPSEIPEGLDFPELFDQVTDAFVEGFFFQPIIYEYGPYDRDLTAIEDNRGNEFNPLKELDKYGRQNPYQDLQRGRPPRMATISGNISSRYPQPLLQNLEGKDSILGRGMCMEFGVEVDGRVELLEGFVELEGEGICCIIARDAVPAGFGPKPIPYPLTTDSRTYASYGANYAVPKKSGHSHYAKHAGGHSYGH